jgi:cell fate (sporulation/competence/biofilm development) regulator YlbF (YheA/YmcA/DUF963 family)
MKLYKALKLRKSLIGEINKLKEQIKDKNSYLVGSKNGEKFNVDGGYIDLLAKIDELTNLKFVINESNRNIQAMIYALGEYKALLAFWKEVSVAEGVQTINSYSDKFAEYSVQFDEAKRDGIVVEIQKKVDALQEEVDTYNYTTDIPWGDE